MLLRTWTLAPTSDVKRLHIELDNSALDDFIQGFGLRELVRNDSDAELPSNAEVVARVFIQKHQRAGPSNTRMPACHISTDGFSLSVLYEDKVVEVEGGAGEVGGDDEVDGVDEGDEVGEVGEVGEVDEVDEVDEVEAAADAPGDVVVGDCAATPSPATPEPVNEYLKGTVADPARAKKAVGSGKQKGKRGKYHRKKKKKKKKPCWVEVTRDEYPAEPIVIGLDPGRSNIFYAVRMTDGKVFKLTRREYYHLSGINDRKFAMARLGEGLEPYHRQLSREGSLKFGRYEELIAGLILRTQYYNEAWTLYGENPKRAKLAFKVYCGKARTLQQKLNEFGTGLTREEKKRIVVGYGDGKFPSHGPRGELAVPVKRPRRMCGYTWHTVDVNEAYTTVTCNEPHCREPMVKVMTNIPYYDRSGQIRFKENRGCKRCTSVICRSEHPFKGRDHNAALNIGEITIHMLEGRARPECFTRAYHDARRPRRDPPAA